MAESTWTKEYTDYISLNECTRYDTQESAGKVLEMLEQSTLSIGIASMTLLTQADSTRYGPIFGQKRYDLHLNRVQNWIVRNRTVFFI